MYSIWRMMPSNISAASLDAPPPVGLTLTLALFYRQSLMICRLCWRVLLIVSAGRLSIARALRISFGH
jgi:hypothetical protein